MLKLLNDISNNFTATIETIKVEMLEMAEIKPKAFNGNRDAKELENFIFDMEQYFKAGGTTSEETKITLAFIHLSNDAKLLWRSKVNDIQNGRSTIDT
ncbi:uncharacterized protein E5676_scaffold1415G00550 [Cucumis melo var. makuwa]|uniref:Senescence-specific cysteine protease sag39 n=1 Tax=Cucumis melo var. makuwa TaxID=1194695 RepID=A0A5D3C1N4_CUCMM|nr:uncharacterized protein E6C27_scaffold616G001040 [Cucumis melo var. makuwa]TYK05184.1 uncharacterized protein E5676_scaffold1415G00550 [Cucumis melo var. makuwa]